MIIMMGVSLYTVRIVLDTLGVVDYGIYNVVGGIVTMFSFLSNSMAVASQRFFSFELGKKDYNQLKKTFSITISIYIMLSFVILLLAETVGLWFLNTQMTIPENRIEAANWIYQFSILSFMMTLFTIPYNAAIIAHERMNVYAWVSIIEVILKLLIVYLLLAFTYDKLKLYGVLIFGVTSIITLIFRTYCKKRFKECRFSFFWNKSLFKEILSYSGWNLFGALASIFNNQGVNIVLNMFFGPIVNAAQAIAYQVNGALVQFVQNFMTAARPQIIKYYASGEKEKMVNLVFQSSKFSFLLLFILTMPLLLEANYILDIWLTHTPEYVVLFIRFIIIAALIDSLSHSLMTSAQATGKIKKYTSIIGGVMILNLPVSYLFLKLGYPPQTVFILAIVNSVICLSLRLLLLIKMIQFPVKRYLHKVVLPLLMVTSIAYILPFLLTIELKEGLSRFLIVGFTGLISSLICIYTLSLNKNEKSYIVPLLSKFTKKIIK